MSGSSAIEGLILKRLLLTFPMAKTILISSALVNGSPDSLPDLCVRSMSERISQILEEKAQ